MLPDVVFSVLLFSGAQGTADFAIRTVLPSGQHAVPPVPANLLVPVDPPKETRFDMQAAVRLGSAWGTVTSTRRTPEHNRAVGGVPNSHHLSNRAVDIARRAAVQHAQIERAYKKAGYVLVESLDEGDHSHFAFSTKLERMPKEASAPSRIRVIYTTLKMTK